MLIKYNIIYNGLIPTEGQKALADTIPDGDYTIQDIVKLVSIIKELDS